MAGYYNSHTQALDAGCGNGRVAEHLIACGVAPANITGVDISKANIQIAKKMVPGPKFIAADMRKVTLPPESVDLVIAHMMLEFLDPEGLREALQKFHQVLRIEGTLVYITTHPKSVLSEIGADALQGWHARKFPWGTEIQNYYHSKDEFVTETKNAGFHDLIGEDLKIPPEAKEADGEKYAQYVKNGALRLLVKAHRSPASLASY